MASWLSNLLGKSPFGPIAEHTKKVHECVKLLRPLSECLVEGDFEGIQKLHNEMSRLEHEADKIKSDVRKLINQSMMMSVNRDDLKAFLGKQDDIADTAEDFAVVLILRKTKMHPELADEFLNFVDLVIEVSEDLLNTAEELTILAESAFSGKEARHVLELVDHIIHMEWETDKAQRSFAQHFYSLEDKLDPVTIMMYDKYCRKLGQVANKAEKVGKILRDLIERK